MFFPSGRLIQDCLGPGLDDVILVTGPMLLSRLNATTTPYVTAHLRSALYHGDDGGGQEHAIFSQSGSAASSVQPFLRCKVKMSIRCCCAAASSFFLRRKFNVWKRSALRFERPAAILQARQLILFPEAALLLLLEEGRQQGGGGQNLGKSSMPRSYFLQ